MVFCVANLLCQLKIVDEDPRVDRYFDFGLPAVGLKSRKGKSLELKLRFGSDSSCESWRKVYAHGHSHPEKYHHIVEALTDQGHEDAEKALSLAKASDFDKKKHRVAVRKSRRWASISKSSGKLASLVDVEQTDLEITLPGAEEPELWRSVCVEGNAPSLLTQCLDDLIKGWNIYNDTYWTMGYPEFVHRLMTNSTSAH